MWLLSCAQIPAEAWLVQDVHNLLSLLGSSRSRHWNRRSHHAFFTNNFFPSHSLWPLLCSPGRVCMACMCVASKTFAAHEDDPYPLHGDHIVKNLRHHHPRAIRHPSGLKARLHRPAREEKPSSPRFLAESIHATPLRRCVLSLRYVIHCLDLPTVRTFALALLGSGSHKGGAICTHNTHNAAMERQQHTFLVSLRPGGYSGIPEANGV